MNKKEYFFRIYRPVVIEECEEIYIEADSYEEALEELNDPMSDCYEYSEGELEYETLRYIEKGECFNEVVEAYFVDDNNRMNKIQLEYE